MRRIAIFPQRGGELAQGIRGSIGTIGDPPHECHYNRVVASHRPHIVCGGLHPPCSGLSHSRTLKSGYCAAKNSLFLRFLRHGVMAQRLMLTPPKVLRTGLRFRPEAVSSCLDERLCPAEPVPASPPRVEGRKELRMASPELSLLPPEPPVLLVDGMQQHVRIGQWSSSRVLCGWAGAAVHERIPIHKEDRRYRRETGPDAGTRSRLPSQGAVQRSRLSDVSSG